MLKRLVTVAVLLAFIFASSCTSNEQEQSQPEVKGSVQAARTHYIKGDYEKAEMELFEVLKKDNENPYAYFYLGFCAFRQARFDEARKYLIEALRLNPSTEFCKAIQELFQLENSRIMGSGKGFWFAPTLLSNSRSLALTIMDDTNGDNRVSLEDNTQIVHVQLESRQTSVLLPPEHIYAPSQASPDGKRIVYASIRTDTNGDGVVNQEDNAGIYSFDLENRKETELIDASFHNSDASFAPDGKSVYFASVRIDSNKDGYIDRSDNFAVYRHDLIQHTTTKVLGLAGDCRRPFVTDDENSLLVWGVNEDTDDNGAINSADYGGVYRYDLANPRLEPLIHWYDKVNIFDFFPRGDKLAVVMDPDPGEERDRYEAERDDPEKFGFGLYIMSLDDGERKKVIYPTREVLAQPTLSPDGSVLAFQRRNMQGTEFVCYYYELDKPYLTARELTKILKSPWD